MLIRSGHVQLMSYRSKSSKIPKVQSYNVRNINLISKSFFTNLKLQSLPCPKEKSCFTYFDILLVSQLVNCAVFFYSYIVEIEI